MKKNEKRLFTLSCAAALLFAVPSSASAMHIMEGYLPIGHAVAWGALCLPFLAAGLISIKRTVAQHRKALLILAMAGAYAFVLSALKIPSVTGSSSHPTGTGLGAILFGPSAMSVIGIIVLLFQALLLAHGGLTTLGANTFSMAVAGPVVSWAVWQLCRKGGVNRKVSVFLAAFLGDLLTYCVTSLQLALAYPAPEGGVAASAVSFLGVFAPTQLPLAVIEGILTVLIVMGQKLQEISRHLTIVHKTCYRSNLTLLNFLFQFLHHIFRRNIIYKYIRITRNFTAIAAIRSSSV